MSDGWSGGSFSVSVDMSANDAAGIPIVSSAFSNQMDVVKAGINACLTKDGSNTPSADLPMGNRKHTGVSKATAVTTYIRANEFINSEPIYMVDGETGSLSVSCSTLYWPASATAGMHAFIKMASTKPQATAAEVEIIINGVTTSAVMNDGVSPLLPGALVSGAVHEFIYDGAKMRLLNPAVTMKTFAVGWKCFDLGNVTPVTISGSNGMSIIASWNDGVGTLATKKPPKTFTFQQSTGVFLRWSAVPSYLIPVSTQTGGVVMIASSDTANSAPSSARIRFDKTNSRIEIFRYISDNIGSACQIEGFHVNYVRRDPI